MKKKVVLLLLLGLIMTAPALPAQEVKQGPPSGQARLKKMKAGDDFVTMNFTNIDISALVKVMSELTRRNFILDDHVAGKVTIMTPTKISPREAYQVFLSALEIKGFTAVEEDNVTRIIPAATARQSGLKVYENGITPGEGFATKLIRLNFVTPQEITRTIMPLISRNGSLIAYDPSNSIIITDSVSNIRKIESLVKALDVYAPEGKGKINVYYLRNANSEEVAKLMQGLVSRLPRPAPAARARQPQHVGPSTILEGAVTITADKATNSLIIVASPGDYTVMKDVIQKLDIRRRQVYVEVAIIEMSLSKQRELGFEFNYAPQEIQSGAGAPTTALGGTNFGNIGNVVANGPVGLAALSGLNVGAIKGTFTFKGVEYLNIGALLHALQVDGDVNVLSTPNILTMDNQKAEIMVGENVPFITGQTQNATTGSGTLFNTVERKDVGIKLTITPQISSEDNVRLEINQEISDVIAGSSANPAGPTTSKRSASTTVVVKDQQTMVIGGLIRDNVVSTTSKVPLLGDIPLLGWLFKYKSTHTEKTNLMIFITPYIIKNAEEGDILTRQKNQSLENFREEYHIEKKEAEPSIKPTADGEGRPAGSSPAQMEEEPSPEMNSGTTTSTPEPAITAPMQQKPGGESPGQGVISAPVSTAQPPANAVPPKENTP